MRPVRALRFLIPSKLEGSEAQLTKKQAVLSMHDTYTKLRIINRISRLGSTLSVFVIIRTIHTLSPFTEVHTSV